MGLQALALLALIAQVGLQIGWPQLLRVEQLQVELVGLPVKMKAKQLMGLPVLQLELRMALVLRMALELRLCTSAQFLLCACLQ